jgi:hypothetical protein
MSNSEKKEKKLCIKMTVVKLKIDTADLSSEEGIDLEEIAYLLSNSVDDIIVLSHYLNHGSIKSFASTDEITKIFDEILAMHDYEVYSVKFEELHGKLICKVKFTEVDEINDIWSYTIFNGNTNKLMKYFKINTY